MLDYSFWYDVAKYGNDHWKGCFSEKEIAENAYTYKCEYDWSKANNSLSATIKSVLELLHDDNNEDTNYFISEIDYDLKKKGGDYMSNRLQPVSTNDFRKKLKKNGFQFSRSSTGHEIWERKQSLSIPAHNKEICGGIAKRLSKEYNLED